MNRSGFLLTMAVVSAVTRAADPEAATRALVQDWRRA